MFWIDDDIPVHMDSLNVWIPIYSTQLQNLAGIEFSITYDPNILELDSENCFCNSQTCITSSCPLSISDSSILFFINTQTPGFIDGILISGLYTDIDGELLSLKFNIKGSVGDYSNISFSQLRINDIDFINNVSNGLVTIGNFGCMDSQACNYSSNATFDDGSCAYEFDCNDECGGGAIEDCLGICQGGALTDCNSECGGDAIIDECGDCDGNGIPQGLCDCEGTVPFVYCVDGDGDGLGNPNYTFEFCDLIENNEFPELVLNCNDIDDECISDEFDSCGVCGGSGPDSGTNCCPNTGLSISGNISDDCGMCGGNMFKEEDGFYPDGLCDCDGTPPINYCIDIDGDGDSDSDPFSSCSEPVLGDVFVGCETLNVANMKAVQYNLFSVYPNPFNPSVTIEYEIDKSNFIEMNILDLNGRYLQTLLNDVKAPGQHSFVWTPNKRLSSGVYLLEMKYNNQIFIEKINYIK